MKRFLISALTITMVSGPALASDQLALGIGTDAAETASATELARLHFALSHESGDGARDAVTVPAGDALDLAYAIFARSHESGDGPVPMTGAMGDELRVSTANRDLIALARSRLTVPRAGDADGQSGD